MTLRRARLLLSVAVFALVPLLGPAASMQPAQKRPIEVADVVAWKTLGATVLSADGQWFGYRVAPQEGDGEVVIKRVRGEKEMRFPIGEQPQGEGGGGGRGGAAAGAGSAAASSAPSASGAMRSYWILEAATSSSAIDSGLRDTDVTCGGTMRPRPSPSWL